MPVRHIDMDTYLYAVHRIYTDLYEIVINPAKLPTRVLTRLKN